MYVNIKPQDPDKSGENIACNGSDCPLLPNDDPPALCWATNAGLMGRVKGHILSKDTICLTLDADDH